MEKVFKDEKLLEKVALAETREEAKKACKEGGIELSDGDLDDIAGGLSKTAKIILGVTGAAAAAAGTAAAVYYGTKSKSEPKEREDHPELSADARGISPSGLEKAKEPLRSGSHMPNRGILEIAKVWWRS